MARMVCARCSGSAGPGAWVGAVLMPLGREPEPAGRAVAHLRAHAAIAEIADALEQCLEAFPGQEPRGCHGGTPMLTAAAGACVLVGSVVRIAFSPGGGPEAGASRSPARPCCKARTTTAALRRIAPLAATLRPAPWDRRLPAGSPDCNRRLPAGSGHRPLQVGLDRIDESRVAGGVHPVLRATAASCSSATAVGVLPRGWGIAHTDRDKNVIRIAKAGFQNARPNRRVAGRQG